MLVSDFRLPVRVGHDQLWPLAYSLFKLATVTYTCTEIITSDQRYEWRDQRCHSRVAWEKVRKKLLQNDQVFYLTNAQFVITGVCLYFAIVYNGFIIVAHTLWTIICIFKAIHMACEYCFKDNICIYHFSASIVYRGAVLITDLTQWGWYKIMTISSVFSRIKMCIFWFKFHSNSGFGVVQLI